MNQLSQNELRRERKTRRIYSPPGNKNGTLFFVTINSNKVIDPTTHVYRGELARVDYDTTINGIRELERVLNEDPELPRASIEDYSIEIGPKALRLHTHFTVLLSHSSASHGEYHLDRNYIDNIFRKNWNIPSHENIHVNIMANPYTPETERHLRDYMNQYIGPKLGEDKHLHIVEGPRYMDSRTSKLIIGNGMYPMSRESSRDRILFN